MQLYQDFAPTPMDRVGMPVRGEDNPNMYDKWFVLPTMRTRDSSLLAESNWDAAIASLEKRGDEQADEEGYDDFTTLSFGHWACGWFEIIVAKPLTPAAKIAKDIDAALANYPVLDDADYYKRESDAHHDDVYNHCFDMINNIFCNDLDVCKLEDAFGQCSSDIVGVGLVDGWDPHAVAEKTQWNYDDRTPDDEKIFDALIELSFLQIQLRGGGVVRLD